MLYYKKQNELRTGLTYKIIQIDELFENKMCISSLDNGIEMTVYFSDTNYQSLFDINAKTNILSFNFSNEYLNSFGEYEHFNLPTDNNMAVCCTTQQILHEILNCKLSGLLKCMFFESKAIELLLCFMKCHSVILNSCESCKFLNNPYEKEKIIQAKDILLSDIQKPPTIPELAKLVSINQCYLKKGFKDIFNNTIFGYIQEQRIIKAKLLLTTTPISIAEIAEQVGFSNSSNFTNAFKNFTGILPSDMRAT